MTPHGPGPYYLLGHSPHEMDRLDLQGLIYHDVTLRALVEAGVGPGDRLLDIGCGTGGVALLAADLVGPGGSVVGLDRAEGAVEAARERALAAGARNASFRVGDIEDRSLRGDFDVVVGRFVLMHQPDPVRVLADAAEAVRPGGRVLAIESHMNALLHGAHSFPSSALYDRVVRWKCAVVEGSGADLDAGARLRRTFTAAGLPPPGARLEAPLAGGPDSPYYRYVAESVRSMGPAADRLGHPPFEGLDTLADSLRDEVTASGGVLVAWPVVAAVSTVGG